MKKLTLKNGFFINNQMVGLKGLQVWLGGLMLHGKLSRSRSRFLRLIEPRLVEFEKERTELIKSHSAKNPETGKVIMIYRDKDGKVLETEDENIGHEFKLENKEEFEKAIKEFFEEKFIIDVTPATREDIYNVRDIVFNSSEEFGGAMALRYDEWCQAFENIGEDDEEADKKPAEAVEVEVVGLKK